MPSSELRAARLTGGQVDNHIHSTNLSATATSHHHHHHHGHFRHRDLSLDHRRSRFVYQRSIDRKPLDAAHSVHCEDRCTHVRVCLLMLGQRTGSLAVPAAMGWGLGMHARMTRLSAHRVSTFGVVPQDVCALRRELSGTELAAVVGGVDWTVSIPNKALCQAVSEVYSSHSHTAARYSRDAHL